MVAVNLELEWRSSCSFGSVLDTSKYSREHQTDGRRSVGDVGTLT